MGRRGKKYSSEEIITKLRKAEILSSQGSTQTDICKQLQVSVDTYIPWKKEYGGMRVDQAKRLKELEKENMRLKKLVADLALDKAMLEIDLVNRKLMIRHSCIWDMSHKTFVELKPFPKNKEARSVYITDEIMEILKRRLQEKIRGNDYVFAC